MKTPDRSRLPVPTMDLSPAEAKLLSPDLNEELFLAMARAQGPRAEQQARLLLECRRQYLREQQPHQFDGELRPLEEDLQQEHFEEFNALMRQRSHVPL